MDNNLTPSPIQSNYRDLLDDMSNWRQERQTANLNFYGQAIAAGKVKALDQEFTKRKASCDVCLSIRPAGMRILFLTGKGCHRFHVCDTCFPMLVEATPIQIQIPTQVSN